jgi:hypothetical protein
MMKLYDSYRWSWMPMGVWFHHLMCLSMGKKRADGLGKIITYSTTLGIFLAR